MFIPINKCNQSPFIFLPLRQMPPLLSIPQAQVFEFYYTFLKKF